MCEFVSATIVETPSGLQVISDESLSSHGEAISEYELTGLHYCELEWTEDDTESIEIRIDDHQPESKKDFYKSWILSNWHTRQSLIDYLVEKRLNEVKDVEFQHHSKMTDTVLQYLACDFAEHVLHFYEEVYPNDNRPRNAIETKRRFLAGTATTEEMIVARDAARDAARAAWDAAWDAARAAWDAWDAAWDARDAARAAWDAAWNAARAARDAWNAARAAEKEWQIKKILEYINKKEE